MGPEDTLKQYELKINNHRFSDVEPLISDKAEIWFSDGSYCGKAAIKEAFEQTWQSLNNDTYWLTEVNWLAKGDDTAVCLYTFNWITEINGERRTGNGRGTTVLNRENGIWKILHEHLSSFPIKAVPRQ